MRAGPPGSVTRGARNTRGGLPHFSVDGPARSCHFVNDAIIWRVEMEERDLVKGWALSEPKRLMSEQISVRLPVDVWVGIMALCNMFPGRTRTQIIGDLLGAALERVRANLSNEPYAGEKDASPGPHYGQRGRFEYLIDQYMKEFVQGGDWFIEGERGRKAPRQRGAPQATAEARPATATRGGRRPRQRGDAGGRRPRE